MIEDGGSRFEGRLIIYIDESNEGERSRGAIGVNGGKGRTTHLTFHRLLCQCRSSMLTVNEANVTSSQQDGSVTATGYCSYQRLCY
jgi:hypothetical protein